MRPSELETLFNHMRTQAPSRLDRRVYETIDRAARQTAFRLSLWRNIMKSPITKLAIAAIFIVSTVLLVRHLIGGESVSTEPQPNIVQEVEPTPLQEESQPETTVRNELALAQSLYEQKDVPGLLTLLETGEASTQLKVAEYLGDLGDTSALPVLQRLAQSWQGEGENPFQTIVDQIESHRQEQETVTEPNDSPNQPQRIDPDIDLPVQVIPAINPVEKVTYKGIVSNEAGKPVEDVHVWGQSITAVMQCKLLPQETVTDNLGQFTLTVNKPVAGTILYFDHPNYALSWINNLDTLLPDVQHNLNIVLYEPDSVVGVVNDTSGLAIQGAMVEAKVQLETGQGIYYFFLWSINEMAVYTDEQGRFEIDRLPKSARLHLRVSCNGYSLYSTQQDYQANIYPIQAGDMDLEVVLEPGGFIRGQVVYEDGRSYTESAVIIIETHGVHEFIYKTDEQGHFTTTGLSPGTYRINVLSQDATVLCAPMDVQVELNEQGTEAMLMIRQGKPIQVRVVDEKTQQPLSGTFVYAESAQKPGVTAASGSTDAKGLCELQLPPDQYLIHVQGWQAGQVHHFTQEITVLPETEDLSIQMAISGRPVIEGWLVDNEGRPITGSVRIGDTRDTDPSGRFVIPEPFGDPLEYHRGYAFDQDRDIGLAFFWRKADQSEDMIVMLKPLATVTGRVVGPDGSVIRDIKPQLWTRMPNGHWQHSRSNNPWKVTVGDDGVFVIENIPVGLPVDVHAEKPGFQGMAKVGELNGGQILDLGDIVLRGISGVDVTTDWTAVLKGRVINEKGKPVVGYEVNTSVGTTQFKDATNRKGRFTLKGLPKGKRLYVGLYVPGYGHCYQYAFADGNDLELQIFPQGWDLLGKEAPPLLIERWFNHEPLTLEQLYGKVVLLEIGVLLPNYRRDLILTQQMFEKYADRGLEIIAVHQPLGVDWAGKVTEDDIEQYIIDQVVPFIFCLDRGDANGDTYALYDVKAAPALYLIDKQGKVRISPTRDNLEEWIKTLLAE